MPFFINAYPTDPVAQMSTQLFPCPKRFSSSEAFSTSPDLAPDFRVSNGYDDGDDAHDDDDGSHCFDHWRIRYMDQAGPNRLHIDFAGAHISSLPCASCADAPRRWLRLHRLPRPRQCPGGHRPPHDQENRLLPLLRGLRQDRVRRRGRQLLVCWYWSHVESRRMVRQRDSRRSLVLGNGRENARIELADRNRRRVEENIGLVLQEGNNLVVGEDSPVAGLVEDMHLALALGCRERVMRHKAVVHSAVVAAVGCCASLHCHNNLDSTL